jgi:hypothetical protein
VAYTSDSAGMGAECSERLPSILDAYDIRQVHASDTQPLPFGPASDVTNMSKRMREVNPTTCMQTANKIRYMQAGQATAVHPPALAHPALGGSFQIHTLETPCFASGSTLPRTMQPRPSKQRRTVCPQCCFEFIADCQIFAFGPQVLPQQTFLRTAPSTHLDAPLWMAPPSRSLDSGCPRSVYMLSAGRPDQPRALSMKGYCPFDMQD